MLGQISVGLTAVLIADESLSLLVQRAHCTELCIVNYFVVAMLCFETDCKYKDLCI